MKIPEEIEKELDQKARELTNKLNICTWSGMYGILFDLLKRHYHETENLKHMSSQKQGDELYPRRTLLQRLQGVVRRKM